MPGDNPLVSVVMPVRNEADAIGATIDSILSQTYPGPIEIVVADGMSTDGTREVLDEVSSSSSRIRYVDNLAVAASHGSVVVRCDGHAELPPDYISTALAILEETGAVNVGGIQDAIGTTPMQRAIAYAMSSRAGTGDARFHYGGEPGPTDTVYLGVFRRDALLDAGLFDETLIRNQDYELNIRLRRNGGTVWFDPRLRVVYRPRSTLRALWRQYFQYGSWKRKVIRMHPESTRLRQLIAPLFVLSLAASGAVAFTPWRPAGLIAPVAYGIVLISATAATLVRRRDPAALLLPGALTTMHLSWGIGFLIGGRERSMR
jgi:succinoglycan biosynthesis protein ExoA